MNARQCRKQKNRYSFSARVRRRPTRGRKHDKHMPYSRQGCPVGRAEYLSYYILSDGKTAKCLQEVAIDGLVVLDSLGERHVHNLIVLNADHHIALVFHKSIDGGGTHT